MNKPTPHVPDITVTRDDVLALPLRMNLVFRSAEPRDGHVWSLVQLTANLARAPWQIGRLTWVEHPEAEPTSCPNARILREDECDIAERAFLWQTAIASDAALSDIGRDNVTEIHAEVRATLIEEARTAMRRITAGVKA